jgi:hypothetical protein
MHPASPFTNGEMIMKTCTLIHILSDAANANLQAYKAAAEYLPEDELNVLVGGDIDDVVRCLYDELPDQFKSEEISDLVRNFYWHIHETRNDGDRTATVKSMVTAARKIYFWANNLYMEMQVARTRFGF